MRSLRTLGLSTLSVENHHAPPVAIPSGVKASNDFIDAVDISADVEVANYADIAYESLQTLVKELDVALSENGGLTVEESDILTKEYREILTGISHVPPLCPSMESYGINDFHREEATKLLRQNVVLSTEGIGDTIIKIFKAIWEKIKAFFKNAKIFMQKQMMRIKVYKQKLNGTYISTVSEWVKKNGYDLVIWPESPDGVVRVADINQLMMHVTVSNTPDKSSRLLPNISTAISQIVKYDSAEVSEIVIINNYVYSCMYNNFKNATLPFINLEYTLKDLPLKVRHHNVNAVMSMELTPPTPVYEQRVKRINLNSGDLKNAMCIDPMLYQNMVAAIEYQMNEFNGPVDQKVTDLGRELNLIQYDRKLSADEKEKRIEEVTLHITILRNLLTVHHQYMAVLCQVANEIMTMISTVQDVFTQQKISTNGES